jgi:hypothetical protein
MCRSDAQYFVVSIREVKYTRLWYTTRLSRLHTLNPPFSISFSVGQPFGNIGPEQENNQGTQINHRYLKQTRLWQDCTTQTSGEIGIK